MVELFQKNLEDLSSKLEGVVFNKKEILRDQSMAAEAKKQTIQELDNEQLRAEANIMEARDALEAQHKGAGALDVGEWRGDDRVVGTDAGRRGADCGHMLPIGLTGETDAR